NHRLASSAETSNIQKVSLSGLAVGTYYLHVFGTRGETSPGYILAIDAPQVARPDWAEKHDNKSSNDTRTDAYDLRTVEGSIALPGVPLDRPGDQDHSVSTTAATGGVNDVVRLRFNNAEGNIDLRVYDSQGRLVGEPRTANDEEQVSLKGLAADTYEV